MERWPSKRNNVKQYLQLYWTFRDELVMVNGIGMKGKGLFIPVKLQPHTLEQVHINHMVIEKTRL